MRPATKLFAMTGLLGTSIFVGAMRAGEEKSSQRLGAQSSSSSSDGEESRDEEKTLHVGDAAPEFQCVDDQGDRWDSRDHFGKKVVVLYFYLSDFAFCCTRQAIRYRDCQKEMTERDVEVVGISGDDIRAHRLFKDAHGLKQALLSDSAGNVAQQFGVPLRNGGKAMVKGAKDRPVLDRDGQALEIPRCVTAARWTFIIGKDGRIIYRETDVSPVKDSQEVLEFLRKNSRSQTAADASLQKN